MPTEKVKIFTKGVADDFESLENEVNEWLKDPSILEVISRHVSTSVGTDMFKVPFVNCTICIFYRGGI